VFNRIFLTAGKIGESVGSYQEYPSKSVGQARKRIPDNRPDSAGKKLGLFIRNLVQLVNSVLDKYFVMFTYTRLSTLS
jgi:hypothetical protein